MRNKRRLLRAESGLTIIEIIVVLVILSIVMSILGSRILGAGDKSKANITKLKVAEIKAAIEQYRLMHNQVPQNLEDLIRCNEQVGPGCIPPLNDEDSLNDGWGNRFNYMLENGGRAFKITSFGADGVAGGIEVDADIVDSGP